MRVRLRAERGFGLIELLMAMVMLNIGILAIVGAFNSGIFALNRASRITTASALADPQMELYRALTYAGDRARLDHARPARQHLQVRHGARRLVPERDVRRGHQLVHGALPNECNPSRTATGADRKNYRVDTYITPRRRPAAARSSSSRS